MARKKSEPIVVEVVDNADLEKNLETGTVTIRNSSLVEARRALKEKMKQDKAYVSSLEERITQLENLIQNLVKSN